MTLCLGGIIIALLLPTMAWGVGSGPAGSQHGLGRASRRTRRGGTRLVRRHPADGRAAGGAVCRYPGRGRRGAGALMRLFGFELRLLHRMTCPIPHACRSKH